MADELVQEGIGEEELETDQYLVFSVKSQEFGFQAVRVREITALLDTTGVPNAPPYVEGIVNLRGRLATLINLRQKLGFETKKHDEDTRIIVVEQGGAPIGILVDAVEEVIRVPDEAVQKLHEATGAPASEESITGVGVLGDRLITLLDVDKVLTKAELAEAGAISQKMERDRQETQEAAGAKRRDVAAEGPVIKKPALTERDDLTEIKGIGETYARKLKAAGVHTFAALAERTADELAPLLDLPKSRLPDVAAWIDQAAELSRQREV